MKYALYWFTDYRIKCIPHSDWYYVVYMDGGDCDIDIEEIKRLNWDLTRETGVSIPTIWDNILVSCEKNLDLWPPNEIIHALKQFSRTDVLTSLLMLLSEQGYYVAFVCEEG